ncbi:hypothetical protein LguiB_009648 [Lonicera macranthoides]
MTSKVLRYYKGDFLDELPGFLKTLSKNVAIKDQVDEDKIEALINKLDEGDKAIYLLYRDLVGGIGINVYVGHLTIMIEAYTDVELILQRNQEDNENASFYGTRMNQVIFGKQCHRSLPHPRRSLGPFGLAVTLVLCCTTMVQLRSHESMGGSRKEGKKYLS